jgi:hypothetical protein
MEAVSKLKVLRMKNAMEIQSKAALGHPADVHSS